MTALPQLRCADRRPGLRDAALTLTLAMGLAGCVLPAGPNPADPTSTTARGVPDEGGTGGATGRMALAAPSGFCVVNDSRVRRDGAEFVAMRPCPGRSAPVAAVLTIAAGAPGSAEGLDLTGAGLAAYFTGTEGRRALSRSGAARSVTVHEVLNSDGAVLLRLTDSSPPAEGQGWRAVLALQGRLVTLTARAQNGGGLTRDDGYRLIRRMVQAMVRANRG